MEIQIHNCDPFVSLYHIQTGSDPTLKRIRIQDTLYTRCMATAGILILIYDPFDQNFSAQCLHNPRDGNLESFIPD